MSSCLLDLPAIEPSVVRCHECGRPIDLELENGFECSTCRDWYCEHCDRCSCDDAALRSSLSHVTPYSGRA